MSKTDSHVGESGMLWYQELAPRQEFDLEEAVIQACEHYYNKHRVFPRWCCVNTEQLKQSGLQRVAVAELSPDDHVLTNHVWVMDGRRP